MRKTGLYHFAQILLTPIFKLIYRYQVIGSENVPSEGGVLLCGNHTRYKDPIFLGLIQKRQVWFMAKQELFKNKFLAFIITKLGAFPVYRTSGTSAIKRGLDILEQDGIVGIFIEGTRSKTGELLKPKPGATMLAYETKSPVVPVYISQADGTPPKAFKKTIIRVGKPITVEELGMEDGSGMAMRKASRGIMEEIRKLKEETVTEYSERKR